MILIATLLLIAGIANGLGDRIKFHNPFPDSGFWSAGSWVNVYKNKDPLQGRRFIGSTSYLAFLCDGWHLLKMVWVESLCIALGVAWGTVWAYLITRISFFIGFQIGYKLRP